jgi:hypothetical protein
VSKQQSLPAILTAACAVILLAAAPARAAGAARVSESPTDRVIALNKRAFADIQSQHYQAAKYWLDEALVISETAGLENDEMSARTYVHLAAVALGGPKDRGEALRYLDFALKINPNIALTPGLEIAGLRSAYLQAREQAGLPPNPDPTAPNFDPSLPGLESAEDQARDESAMDELPGSLAGVLSAIASQAAAQPPVRATYAAALVQEPDLPARVPVPVYCILPLDLLPGQDLIVRCVTQKRPRKSSATFHYRPDGKDVPFGELPMDRSPKGWLVAVLPASVLDGKPLSYYVTAQLPDVQQTFYLAYPEAPRALAVRSDLLAGGSGVQANAAEQSHARDDGSADRQPHRRPVDSLSFAIGVGSGVVYHGRSTVDSNANIQGTTTAATVKEGFSPASIVQIEPELGYQVTRRLSVSLMGRYQYAPADGNTSRPGRDEKNVITSAFALFLQARLSSVTMGNFQTYVTGAAGFGRSFLAVIDRDCEGGSCSLDHSDTVHGGAAALAAGMGVLYHLSPQLGVFAEAREIATLPTFMALTEINLGVAMAMQLGRSSAERLGASAHEGGR